MDVSIFGQYRISTVSVSYDFVRLSGVEEKAQARIEIKSVARSHMLKF
jgi:hypothetical protein